MMRENDDTKAVKHPELLFDLILIPVPFEDRDGVARICQQLQRHYSKEVALWGDLHKSTSLNPTQNRMAPTSPVPRRSRSSARE